MKQLVDLLLAITLLVVFPRGRISAQTSFPPFPTDDTCTIVIVGTVHAATNFYDVPTLIRILERVEPELILVELDSSFFTPSMTLKQEFRKISLENEAVSAYLEAHPIPMRPYDIEGRNRIYRQHHYFELQQALSAALRGATHDSLLGPTASLTLDAIIRFDRIGAAFGSERPEVINSAACDAAMESKQYYDGDGMVEIASGVPSLARFADFCRFKRDFWIARNTAMADNILRSATVSPARTIVVFCGYEHRYFLYKTLQKRGQGRRIILKDYWAY